MHCEINAWQHILDLLYSESPLRCCFEKFVETLSAPIGPSGQNSLNQESSEGHATFERVVDVIGEDVHSALASTDNSIALSFVEDEVGINSCQNSSPSPDMLRHFSVLELSKEAASDKMTAMLETSTYAPSNTLSEMCRCGLAYLSTKVKEHYADETKRANKLSVRHIGAQAIPLARYSYRIVDSLQTANENEGKKLQRLALGKVVQYLRNAGGLFNKFYVNIPGEISHLIT